MGKGSKSKGSNDEVDNRKSNPILTVSEDGVSC